MPVLQLEMPANQVNTLPELRRLLSSAKRSVHHLGLRGNALGIEGAKVLAENLGRCEVSSLQLQNCLLGPEGVLELAKAFLQAEPRKVNPVTMLQLPEAIPGPFPWVLVGFQGVPRGSKGFGTGFLGFCWCVEWFH